MSKSSRSTILLAFACALISLALFMIPAWVIQPFRAQDQGMLRLALLIRRIAPLATLLLLVLGIVLVFRARPRRWALLPAVLSIALLVLSVVIVRVNYFELMFHPNPAPVFVSVRDANVDSDDMVMVARI